MNAAFILFVIVIINFNWVSGEDYTSTINSEGQITRSDIQTNENIQISNDTSDAIEPRIVKGIGEDLYIVWTDTRSVNESDLYLKRSTDNGITFEEERLINADTSGFQSQSDIYVDENGTIFVIWRDYKEGEMSIQFTKSIDRGLTFAPSKRIDNGLLSWIRYQPRIITFQENIYIVFKGDDGFDYITQSFDGGDIFQTPHSIGKWGVFSIDIDSKGNIFGVYCYNGLYITLSENRGNYFQDPIKISNGSNFISMEIDIQDDIHLAWNDVKLGFTCYAKSSDKGNTFTKLTYLEDSPSLTSSYTDIAVDTYGGVYVVWCDEKYEHFDVFLAYSNNWGLSFSKAIRLNDDIGVQAQIDPVVCVDDVGNLFLAWRDERDGGKNIFYMKRESINHPPQVIREFPDKIHFSEDISSNSNLIDLNEYFWDDQGFDNLTVEIYDDENTTLFEPSVNDGFLTFDQKVPNIFGSFGFHIWAHDSGDDGYRSSDDLYAPSSHFTLDVQPVNDPPIIIGVGEHPVKDGIISIPVLEDNWFNSSLNYEEFDGEDCTFSCIEDHPDFFLDGVTGYFSFIPGNEDVGYVNFSVRVEDVNRTFDEIIISFDVLNTNDPPQISLDNHILETNEDVPIENIDLNTWFFDVDADQLSFISKDHNILDVIITRNTHTLSIYSPDNWYGKEKIIIGADDGQMITWIEVEVNIISINDIPRDAVIVLLQDTYKEGEKQMVSGSAVDSDDEENLTYTWLEGEKVLGTGKEFDLGLSEGSHKITLRASDPSGFYAEASISIDVENRDNHIGLIMIIVGISVIIILGIGSFFYFKLRSRKEDQQIEQSDEILET